MKYCSCQLCYNVASHSLRVALSQLNQGLAAQYYSLLLCTTQLAIHCGKVPLRLCKNHIAIAMPDMPGFSASPGKVGVGSEVQGRGRPEGGEWAGRVDLSRKGAHQILSLIFNPPCPIRFLDLNIAGEGPRRHICDYMAYQEGKKRIFTYFSLAHIRVHAHTPCSSICMAEDYRE